MEKILKWIIFLLAFLNFGYMLTDGMIAFISGDYIRPESGEYAGQLGPWSHLVRQVGIDPVSDAMKAIFVVLGLVGWGSIFLSIRRPKNVLILFIVNVLSLWYLIPGTILACIQIVLIVVLVRKSNIRNIKP